MRTYPLESMNISEAIEKQFLLIDIISRYLTGYDFLNLGDLGVHHENNMPVRTRVIEKIIAEFLGSEDAILVRGSGTNALRQSFYEALEKEEKILVHDAPIYKTSEITLKSMKVKIYKYNFNNLEDIEDYLLENDIKVILLQHTRQKIEDKYNLYEVIKTIKNINKNIKIIVDDNYAVLKTRKNGVEMGADLSTFSSFKLLGPLGIGVIIGKKEIIDKIRTFNYSGGSQVQGYEAMEVIRGLCYAPVSLSIQAQEIERLNKKLKNKDQFPYIKDVYIANAQSKVLLIEFRENIAKKFLEYAYKNGALPHPVGAESKFELLPLIYRVSGTFLSDMPELKDRMIRINPNRASSETIIKIIEKTYNAIK